MNNKEIIVKFGSRSYVFYSQTDVTKATSIYAHNTGTLDDFEEELDEANIDFCYDLYFC